MSYDESMEMTAAPGGRLNDLEKAGTEASPKKRTVRQFLNQYRSLGLPGHKKARKAHRIATLQAERDFMAEMVRRAALLNAKANSIIRALIDESNFGIQDLGDGTGQVLWLADDTALENARAYLKEFRSGSAEQVEHVAKHGESHPAHDSVKHAEALPS